MKSLIESAREVLVESAEVRISQRNSIPVDRHMDAVMDQWAHEAEKHKAKAEKHLVNANQHPKDSVEHHTHMYKHHEAMAQHIKHKYNSTPGAAVEDERLKIASSIKQEKANAKEHKAKSKS